MSPGAYDMLFACVAAAMPAVVVRGMRGGAVPRRWPPVTALSPLACLCLR